MTTFFISWPLWQQMTFVLLGSLIFTIGAGLTKNVYSWRRSRRFARILFGSKGGQHQIAQDMEARGMAMIDEVPFGVKALQQGVEVEGIWVSQPNTPAPGSPEISALPSPVASIVEGWGPGLRSSGNTSPPDIAIDDYIESHHKEDVPRDPGSAHKHNAPRLEVGPHDIHEDPSTLDALEGRYLPYEQSQDDLKRYYSRSSRQSRSALNSPRSDRSSAWDSCPSPPTLTDGVSRSDTPLSTASRPNLSSYLSESNHRLSHVAETGRLHPRVRLPRTYDNLAITESDASSYRSTLHVPYGGESSRNPTQYSSSPSPPSPMDFSSTDSQFHGVYGPQATSSAAKPTFDAHSIHSEPPKRVYFPRHFREMSNSQVIAGQHPSPILVEYMSQSLVRDFTARHIMDNRDVSRSRFHQPPPVPSPAPPLPPSIPDSHYRKRTDEFDQRRGIRGSLNAPLTSPLELPSLDPYDFPKSERRKSRKLQKKRPRSKSFG